MAEFEEVTEEQIEQMKEWIAVQVEQTRLGKKDNEQAIKLWLEKNKYGRAITDVSKATKSLTKGFVDSATAMADSTGDFGSLSGAVGGTIKSFAGLAGAMSNILGAIPVVGQGLDAMGDAAIAFAKFGLGELQKTFNSFQELSDAGQIGAGGIEEMASRMRATNMPLATYSKLLKENSTDLAFLSESALAGGKSFSTTMASMANDTGMPLRRLGLSVAEIGDTVVDFQVMQRRQGLLGQLSQEQIRKGTVDYAKELDLIAKLTGKSRKEIQKEREETMSDSRFRAAMMDRSKEEQQKHIDAIAQISDPTLKRAYMDQVSGFTNSTASITAEISGMGGAIRGAIAHIDDLGGNSTDAINIMRKQALAVTEAGGVLQSYSKVVESGGGVMMHFSKLRDFAVETMKSQAEAAAAQIKQMQSVGSAADEMANMMRKLQSGTAIMNSLFTKTETAAKMMGEFADVQLAIMGYAEDLIESDKSFVDKITDDAAIAAKKVLNVALDLNASAGQVIIDSVAEGFTSVFGSWTPDDLMSDEMKTDHRPTGNGTAYDLPPGYGPQYAGPVDRKPAVATSPALELLQEQRDTQTKKLQDYNNRIGNSPGGFSENAEARATSDKMSAELRETNELLRRLIVATGDGTRATEKVSKAVKNGN